MQKYLYNLKYLNIIPGYELNRYKEIYDTLLNQMN